MARYLPDFDDETYARFHLLLFRHNIKRSTFFRNIMKGFINEDEHIMNFINNVKTTERIQSKTQCRIIEQEETEQEEVVELFALEELTEEEKREIFTLLESDLEYG